MGLFSLLLLAISLSVDCFIICLIFGMQRAAWKTSLKAGEKDPFPALSKTTLQAALVFALCHILMIVLGWLLGWGILPIVERYAYWVAFAILCAVGLKTIIDGFNKKENSLKAHAMFGGKSMLLLSVAVSVDAFAVGVSMKMVGMQLPLTCLSVGAIVFLLSCAGVLTGFFLHRQMQKVSTATLNLIGGLVLIGIGVRILVSNLNA
ncbi:MAG: manganese efflux pump MntP family protein [Bacteroides sp.]|nr:manganese efflux pump MntP family protein [Ruminococcus flavefaciens]MCM1555091.1 manganese efflux pump MntP family protein [Bacteroides sp.]MCM1555458.1 manganese efflux pump MntP family protein [Bacteroides sp.]